MLKRQRELKKAEKAAKKRAKRHGLPEAPMLLEPTPTVTTDQLLGRAPAEEPAEEAETNPDGQETDPTDLAAEPQESD